MQTRHRYFFAVPVPQNYHQSLRSLCHGLPDTRWVAEASFHITLAFLGELTEERLEKARLVLADGLDFDPFDVRLSGVHCFRPPRARIVLWAGVEEQPDLGRLHSDLRRRLSRSGFRVDKKAFRPHVTLGRAATSLSEKRLHDWLELHREFREGPFRVGSIALYQSTLYPDGARYRIVESCDSV